MNPFFSILVPVYNHEKYVGLALDSLLAQTDPDWEACVVNDGSTDGTAVILAEYAARDSRIRVFHQANGGQAVALNSGLREARGEWICWLSSDDLFEPCKLAVHRQWVERFPKHRYFFSKFRVLDDATGRITASDQGAIPPREWQVLDLLSYNYINGIAFCIHRDAFHEVGVFDSQNRYGQDYDLHLRMLSRYEAIPIPVETCISRVHARQFSRIENRSMFYDCAAAALGFLNRTSFSGLFPLLDLRDEAQAITAVDRGLDVAMSCDAYVNQLGPHPLLLARIMEWVWGQPGRAGRKFQDLVEWRIKAMAERFQPGQRRGSFWRAAALLVALNPELPGVISCTPAAVADALLADLSARGDAEADAVSRFIEKRQNREPHEVPARRMAPHDLLVNGMVTEDIVCGFARQGWCVTRLDMQTDGLGLHEWGWSVGARSARRPVSIALASVPPWDAAVEGNGILYSLEVASRTHPVQAAGVDCAELGCMLEHVMPVGRTVRGVRRLRRLQGKVQRVIRRQ